MGRQIGRMSSEDAVFGRMCCM